MTETRKFLDDYTEHGSEAAFRELVARYLDLVYSTALRFVRGDAAMAQDVAQTVFLDLARSARKLSGDVLLGGWLHRHTCFVAANLLRAERRRKNREQQAAEMNALTDHSQKRFEEMTPYLDEAINELGATDRKAIVLRFYERLDFREVGMGLGSTEAAAQKRVGRAVEKLHALLRRKGITLSAAALGTFLAGEAVRAAPAGLAASISSAAVSGASAGAGGSTILAKLMAATKLKVGLTAVTVVACIATPLMFEHVARARLLALSDVRQRQASAIAQLQAENGRLNEVAASTAVRPSATNDQMLEVLRLRAEVGRLRNAVSKMVVTKEPDRTPGPDQLAALKQMYAGRAEQLHQWVSNHPAMNIPELEKYSESEWLMSSADVQSNEDLPRAAANLRINAEMRVMDQLGQALKKYIKGNDGQFPGDLSQLRPYLETPIDDEILKRYEIVPANTLVDDLQTGDPWVITQVAPVDPDLDMRIGMGLSNMVDVGVTVSNRWKTITPVMK